MNASVLTDAAGRSFELRPMVCPTCDTRAETFLGYRGGLHHGYGLGVESRIVRCRTCGLIFPDPFPFPLEPQEMYGDPETYFEDHDEATKVEAQGTIVAEILRRTRMSNPSILDVGSGRGELLEAARLAGLDDAVGLELSTAMAGYAAQRFHADVRRQLVEDHAESAGRTYDAVVASEVLEHVHDPNSMIAAIGALTRPGAVLYLDLPNEPNLLTVVGGAVKRIGGSRTIYNLSPTFSPFHVFGFNRRALTALLTKHGFAPEAFFVWADPHIPARSGGADRAKALLATQVRRLANRTGTASNMCVWARRLAREASPSGGLARE